MGTVLVEAEEGGAAQQQWHRSASECAEAPRRGTVKPSSGRARGVERGVTAWVAERFVMARSDGLHCTGLPPLSVSLSGKPNSMSFFS